MIAAIVEVRIVFFGSALCKYITHYLCCIIRIDMEECAAGISRVDLI